MTLFLPFRYAIITDNKEFHVSSIFSIHFTVVRFYLSPGVFFSTINWVHLNWNNKKPILCHDSWYEMSIGWEKSECRQTISDSSHLNRFEIKNCKIIAKTEPNEFSIDLNVIENDTEQWAHLMSSKNSSSMASSLSLSFFSGMLSKLKILILMIIVWAILWHNKISISLSCLWRFISFYRSFEYFCFSSATNRSLLFFNWFYPSRIRWTFLVW